MYIHNQRIGVHSRVELKRLFAYVTIRLIMLIDVKWNILNSKEISSTIYIRTHHVVTWLHGGF